MSLQGRKSVMYKVRNFEWLSGIPVNALRDVKQID